MGCGGPHLRCDEVAGEQGVQVEPEPRVAGQRVGHRRPQVGLLLNQRPVPARATGAGFMVEARAQCLGRMGQGRGEVTVTDEKRSQPNQRTKAETGALCAGCPAAKLRACSTESRVEVTHKEPWSKNGVSYTAMEARLCLSWGHGQTFNGMRQDQTHRSVATGN